MTETALIVGILVALLAGGVILGTARKMWRGPITQFDAVGWYLQAALAVLATAALAGAGLILKALVGYIGLQYAYGSIAAQVATGDTVTSSADTALTTARTNDLILGLVLLAGGAGLLYGHLWLGRHLPALMHPRAAWMTWGVPVITVAYWGLIGFATLFAAVYGVLSNASTPHPADTEPSLIGDPLGIGLAFSVGWLALARVLLGTTAMVATAEVPEFQPTSAPPPLPDAPGAYQAYPQSPPGMGSVSPLAQPHGAFPEIEPNPEHLPAVWPPAQDVRASDERAPFSSVRPAPPRATRTTDPEEWRPPEPGALSS